MILTLHDRTETLRIEIDPKSYLRLRDPKISDTEIAAIAHTASISVDILTAYVNDLRKESCDSEEMDGSCDYTDHF